MSTILVHLCLQVMKDCLALIFFNLFFWFTLFLCSCPFIFRLCDKRVSLLDSLTPQKCPTTCEDTIDTSHTCPWILPPHWAPPRACSCSPCRPVADSAIFLPHHAENPSFIAPVLGPVSWLSCLCVCVLPLASSVRTHRRQVFGDV